MLNFVFIFAAVAVYYVQAADKIYGLYTFDYCTGPVNMTITDTALPVTFNPEHKTIILIHGHEGRVGSPFHTLVMREIFEFKKEHNIIVVDWEKEASNSYWTAASYVDSVANHLAGFIRSLVSHTVSIEGINTPVVPVRTLHLVGFGLGAHVAGIASRQLKLSPGLVGRITGLDPSGSGWGSRSPRLTADDAHYVEVIHTDGSGLLSLGIGTAIGHINFYANGGRNQPNCFGNTCNHNRAWELFAASMRGHLFGYPCSTKIHMHLNLCGGLQLQMGGTELDKTEYSHSDTRIYRINTGRSFPF